MEAFVIFLQNDKIKSYRYITLFVLVMNLVAFSYIALHTQDSRLGSLTSMGIFLSFTYVALFLIKQYTKYLTRYRLEISFLVLGMLWLTMGMWLITVMMILCTVLGFYTLKKSVVTVNRNGVSYPSVPVKNFLWNEMENVVLKDDILTIDLKNNKLMQANIDLHSTVKIDETKFNEFCRLNLQ